MSSNPNIDENGRWIPSSPQYKIRAGVCLALFIVHMIYALVTLVMFLIKARDRHSGLAQRSVPLVALQAFGLICVAVIGGISTALQEWPCFLKLWFGNVGYYALYSAIAARSFQHVVISNVHILTNKVASSKNSDFKGVMHHHQSEPLAYLNQGARQVRSASQSSTFSNTIFDSETNRLNRSSHGEKKNIMNLTSSLQATPAPRAHVHDGESNSRLYKRLKRYTKLQRYASDKALVIFVLAHVVVALIISLVVNIVNDQYSLRPIGVDCTLMWGFLPLVIVPGFYVVFVLPVLLVKCWSLKDAYGIRNDLYVSIIVGALCIVLTIVWQTALFDIALKLSGWFFSWLCAIILHTVSLAIPLWSAMRHSQDVLSRMHGASALAAGDDPDRSMAAVIANAAGGSDVGRRAEFNGILADPYEYRYFCDFAASCFCSEMTAFIDEYQSLKAQTIIALGSEDIWREDADQLDPGYMARMASNIDSDIGYLALANRDNAHSKSLRLQTPPTVCILDTARAVYPQYDLSEVTPFPVASLDKLVVMLSVFVNSNSYTAVNLPSAMVLRIRERLGRSQLTLTIFDEIKDEVLNMLYFDVFTRYIRRK
ncbi:hypothetical protein GGI11_001785 [Coemansia sp. RSA 2049]|nr:hypothetical protein H4217_001837 [Coemansia sp. RSA 1939]KAJ2522251.1 hypothetical protein GGI11_001785 [Coemansia sp. RSA 2049]KAJ2693830.1 hypothetical protein GGH99_000962 [Coemansia sp. RSA 1285]